MTEMNMLVTLLSYMELVMYDFCHANSDSVAGWTATRLWIDVPFLTLYQCFLLVSDRRWLRPKVSAETEYSVTPAKNETQNCPLVNIQSKKNVKKSMQKH
jgi:hypothetical protein